MNSRISTFRVSRWALALLPFLVVSEVRGLEPTELKALLEEARIIEEMPGVRAAVRFSGGRMVSAAVGLADRSQVLPLDDSTPMPGGSTGKTFVAALTLLLVENGVLTMDGQASRWLGDTPWYPRLPNADAIEVAHLLSHSTGIIDYPETVGFNTAMIWRVLRRGSAYFTPEELIDYALDRRASFPSGQGFRYSDTGYLVLGRLLEAASGRDYYELLDERILQPVGLTHTRPQNDAVLEGVVMGYMGGAPVQRDDGRMKFDPRSEWTGGGLLTTAIDLASFFGQLAEGGIVSPESFRAMLSEGWREPGVANHYGLGVFVWADDGSFGHGGLWPGYRSWVLHRLESGVTVAVQTNRDGRVDLESLARRIADASEAPAGR